MSHFAVYVFGHDIDGQLAPFHEFECTGIDDQYVVEVDRTDEARALYAKEAERSEPFAEWALGWYGGSLLQRGRQRTDDHKYGFVEIDDAGNVIRVVRRTNPNKKWDWYVVGGRWDGALTSTTGPVSQCRVGDLDFDADRDKDEAQARKLFAEWSAIVTEHGRPDPWSACRERNTDIDAARKEYHSQPAIAAANRSKALVWVDVDALGFDVEPYVARVRASSMTPFAYIRNGEWRERGRMGWFGVAFNEQDADAWAREFHDYIATLPADTMVSVVDCHI